MTLGKTPTTVISNVTLGNSGTSDSIVIDLSTAVDWNIGVIIPFASGATAGIRFDLYQDPTSANNSFSIGANDAVIDSYTITQVAGQTVNTGFRFNRSAKYVRIRAVNLDSSHSITGLYVYSTPQA